MGRQEKSLDPTHGPVERFAHDLRQLRQQAGTPTYRAMAATAHCSASSLSAATSGARLPTLTVTLAYVRACDGDPQQWQQRWHATRQQHQQEPTAAPRTTAPPPDAAPDTATSAESSDAAGSAPDRVGAPVPAGNAWCPSWYLALCVRRAGAWPRNGSVHRERRAWRIGDHVEPLWQTRDLQRDPLLPGSTPISDPRHLSASLPERHRLFPKIPAVRIDHGEKTSID
jgi:Helix-turn-helix domain